MTSPDLPQWGEPHDMKLAPRDGTRILVIFNGDDQYCDVVGYDTRGAVWVASGGPPILDQELAGWWPLPRKSAL